MEKPYVVGIDIGGTNTVFGVVDARGTILYSSSIKTGKYTDVPASKISDMATGWICGQTIMSANLQMA